MYPSSPSQPPKPPGTPAKELPGIAKKPTAPFRGQAPTPLTMRDVAASRAQAPTAPAQPKALGAPPKPPQPSPVPSARPVAPAQKETLGGPMADDRLKAMQAMQAKAGPSKSLEGAMGRDPSREVLSPGALGAMRNGGVAGAAAKAAVDIAAKQDAAAKNETLAKGGTGMDMTATFDYLKDPNHEPPPGYEWDPKPNDGGPPRWTPQAGDSALPAGVKAGDPGTYFEGGTWKYDQKDALGEYNLPYTANDLLMGDETQFLMTPEEKAAAQAELDKQAAAGQWAQGNNMAAHGLGGSGVALTGLGDIAAKRMTAENDLNTSDRAQAMAAYMDKLGLVLPATQNATNEADKMALAEAANKTDAERWEYQKEQDAMANTWTQAVNALGITGGDQLDAASLAELLKIPPDQMAAFTAAVGRMVRTKNPDGTITVSLQTDNPQNQVKQESFETLNSDQQDIINWLETEGASKGWSMQTPPPIMGDPNDPGIKAMWDASSDSVKADNWLFYLTSIGIDPRQEPAV
jgi:hypothetical protein